MSHVSTASALWRTTATVGCVFFIALTASAAEAPAALGSYEGYKKAVDAICYAEKASADGKSAVPPWNLPTGSTGQLPPQLLNVQRNDYPDIYDPQSNQKFKDGIQAVKGLEDELSGLIALESQNLPLASQIEKAGLLYRERMNSIYTCAILNSKYKIHTKLAKQFKPEGTNIVRDLEKATSQIRAQMQQNKCRDVSKEEKSDNIELSTKRSLIRQSTIEYCNYRHYLSYVDYNVKNRLSDVIKTEEKLRAKKPAVDQGGADRLPNTEAVAAQMGDVVSRTAKEIAHTQQVYDDAFDAYREFEQTYASHILMVLIEDRYLVIREYLRDTMNPIGQVIYKASNATSPGK